MFTEGDDGDVMKILNTFEYVEKVPGWQIAILVVVGLVLIFFEVFFACQKEWGRSLASAFLALILIGLALLLCSTKIEETRYECAIDDTTSFNEVMENYEVVERRGDIWVLREKVEE